MNVKETAQTTVLVWIVGTPLAMAALIGICKFVIWGLPKLTAVLDAI